MSNVEIVIDIYKYYLDIYVHTLSESSSTPDMTERCVGIKRKEVTTQASVLTLNSRLALP